MAVASGTNGSLTNGSGYSAAITGWTVDVAVAEQEITSWSDASSGVLWREFIPGAREYTGTITARWDPTSDITTGIGTELSVTFTADTEQGASGVGLSGDVIVTGINAAAEIDSASAVSFTFRGAGQLTVTTS